MKIGKLDAVNPGELDPSAYLRGRIANGRPEWHIAVVSFLRPSGTISAEAARLMAERWTAVADAADEMNAKEASK